MRPVTPVGILAERLGRAAARAAELQEVGAGDPDLVCELTSAHALAHGLEHYVADCTSPDSAALKEITRRTREHDWNGHAGPVGLEAEMLSGHVEGATLRFIAWLARARSVLEIGMFTGYSALALAEALPEDGRLIACEIDPEVAEFARAGFAGSEAGSRIEVRVGPARDTLDELVSAGERFDLIFLDADKAGYVDYLGAVLDGGLLGPDGVLCADNTMLQGEPWSPETPSANGAAIACFNAVLVGDPRIEQVLLPVRDGLTLARWAR